MPVQCQQCKNPPCVKVCPVKATWQEPDGITVIDYDWCIGCRYCEAACPYFARRFNWTKPSIPKERLNPNMSYLGNRPRKQGVMEKCHFCIQRTRAGKYPGLPGGLPGRRAQIRQHSGSEQRGLLHPREPSACSSNSRRRLGTSRGSFTTSTYDPGHSEIISRFLSRCGRIAFVGDWRYYAWMGMPHGLCAARPQCLLPNNSSHGLIVTGMSDQVSWGVYIANFTFLVGRRGGGGDAGHPGLYLQ